MGVRKGGLVGKKGVDEPINNNGGVKKDVL